MFLCYFYMSNCSDWYLTGKSPMTLVNLVLTCPFKGTGYIFTLAKVLHPCFIFTCLIRFLYIWFLNFQIWKSWREGCGYRRQRRWHIRQSEVSGNRVTIGYKWCHQQQPVKCESFTGRRGRVHYWRLWWLNLFFEFFRLLLLVLCLKIFWFPKTLTITNCCHSMIKFVLVAVLKEITLKTIHVFKNTKNKLGTVLKWGKLSLPCHYFS